LTDELLKGFETQIASLELIPSSGGVFEVQVNGSLIYSKKATGRHAATGEILNLVKELAGDHAADAA
jgi:selenoprotein W-related protein